MFTQTATTLQENFTSGVPATSTGTIDPSTGIFSVDMHWSVLGIIPCAEHIDAVASPDGLSFSGTVAGSCPSEGVFYAGTVTAQQCGAGGADCCGNGVIDAGEFCDGICCNDTCTAFLSGASTCTTDSNLCTDDVCDGAGHCVHVANTLPCTRLNPCEPGRCAGGSCTEVACRTPARTKLKIKRELSSGIVLTPLKWRWTDNTGTVMPASFGDPTLPVGATAYTFCVDMPKGASHARLAFGLAPQANWQAVDHGFTFTGSPDINGGIDATLKALTRRAAVNVSMRTSIQPLASGPVLVRLLANGQPETCFEATYSSPKKNTTELYVATE